MDVPHAQAAHPLAIAQQLSNFRGGSTIATRCIFFPASYYSFVLESWNSKNKSLYSCTVAGSLAYSKGVFPV